MAGVKTKDRRAEHGNPIKMHLKNVKGSEFNFPSDFFDIQGQFQQVENDRLVQQISDKRERRHEEGGDYGNS